MFNDDHAIKMVFWWKGAIDEFRDDDACTIDAYGSYRDFPVASCGLFSRRAVKGRD